MELVQVMNAQNLFHSAREPTLHNSGDLRSPTRTIKIVHHAVWTMTKKPVQ